MKTHGMCKTPEYKVWTDMKSRCFNHNHKRFSDYGGRGISVCDRWKNSFQAFYQDMGQRPSDKHSIDRLDNNGNYEPGNCEWVDGSTQVINRGIFKNNTSGFKGVTWYKRDKKWRSVIKINRVTFHIGYFSTPELAAIARDAYIIENELSEYSLQVLPEP